MTAYKTPVSVLVVIHTVAGEFLLIERAAHPGYWQSVTGSLEATDTDLATTARREVFEETGIPPELGNLTDWRLSNRYEIFPEWRHRYAPGVTTNTVSFSPATPVAMNVDPMAPPSTVMIARYRNVRWYRNGNGLYVSRNGAAGQQVADAQQIDRVRQRHLALGGGHALQAEIQVALHRQVLEQAGLLKHIANRAAMHGQPAPGVLPDFIAHAQTPMRRALQAGNAAQQRGFARAGVAKQRGDAVAGQGEIHIQRKPWPVQLKTRLNGAHVAAPRADLGRQA